MEAGSHGADHMTHFRTCLLHDDKKTIRCSGTLKRGGNCVNRAAGSFEPGMMPTCHVHQRQLKRMGWCRAPLRCGFECGRICEWKLHGFQLCLNHCEHPMTCYFLKAPMIEPIWDPPLSKRYFNMIQSFRIEIVLPSPSAWWVPDSDAASHKASMSRLLNYCDHLHRLIWRLRSIQRPIARLEIVIRFGNAYLDRRDAFPIAQFLMRPFRRLHNVAKPKLLSIMIQDSPGEVELLTRDWVSSPAGGKLAAYLEHLYEHMSSSQSPPEVPVFKAYWQLEKLLSYMKEHYRHSHPKIEKFTGLLYTARFAREVEDLSGFRAIWKQVVDIWSDCLNERVEFQSNVALSIDAIHGTVQKDSWTRGETADSSEDVPSLSTVEQLPKGLFV